MGSPTTLETFDAAGLTALVRAGEAKQWFAGHYGATLIAGARLLRNPDLPGPAALALSARLQDLVTTNPGWFTALPNGPMGPASASTASGPARDPEALVEVLRRDARTLRSSGHATIYVSAALDALFRHPGWATDRVLDGLIALHAAGQADDPARYFGTKDYFEFTARPLEPSEPRLRDSIDAFRAGIGAIDHLVPDREIEGRRYFLTGEKLHLLTHAHAIATFEALGLHDVAARALQAQADLVRLVEPSRTLDAPEIESAEATPFEARFWEQPVPDVFHVIKVAEAVVAQVPRLHRDERNVALERVARLWTGLGIR